MRQQESFIIEQLSRRLYAIADKMTFCSTPTPTAQLSRATASTQSLNIRPSGLEGKLVESEGEILRVALMNSSNFLHPSSLSLDTAQFE
jgi:hypothetical protein